jgi:hypothetical protein
MLGHEVPLIGVLVARSHLGGPFRTTAWNHRRKIAE